MIHYSIIIPAYNEERRISRALSEISDYMTRLCLDAEIIVVSDGSTDRTEEIVRANAKRSGPRVAVRLLSIPHMGKGAAVYTGVMEAVGQLIYICDADLSTPISELMRFRARMKQTGADIVIGSREKDRSGVQATKYRRLAGRLFHLAARILVPGVSDTQCGFKLYTFRAAKAIFSRARINRFAYEVEALWLARRMGYKIVEIGVLWVHDPDSRIRVVRDGMRMLIDVISIPIIHWRAWNEKVFEYR